MEAICATGIPVSELKFFTLEAVKAGKAVVTNKGKTREVYLPGKLCKRLREYARVHGVVSGPVLVTRGGQPLDRSNLWREMKALCREARVAAGRSFPITSDTSSPGHTTRRSGIWPVWRTSWATPAWTPPGSTPWRRG